MFSCSSSELKDLAQAFKALSNPNRLAMYLELLRHNETNVKSCGLSELINRLEIGPPTVSHHTKELVSAGLIEVDRDGKFIRCRLNDELRQKLMAFFQG